LKSGQLLAQVFHLPVQAFLNAEDIRRVKSQLSGQLRSAQGPGIFTVARVVETDIVGDGGEGGLAVGSEREEEEKGE